MTYQTQLSDVERNLVLQLLDSERSNLHPEIRRSTMSPQTHGELQQRLKLVNELMERLQQTPLAG
jgi:hypothetical protein